MPATDPQLLVSQGACYACLGMSLSDSLALALWDSISQNITPSGETFFILSNVGDSLISQVGDNLVYQ